mgnify:CR=1 FL=1
MRSTRIAMRLHFGLLAAAVLGCAAQAPELRLRGQVDISAEMALQQPAERTRKLPFGGCDTLVH